jgi:dTDP-4-amino-4,6-dideoxygalactose transaminase
LRTSGVEILLPWGGRGVHQLKNLGLPPVSLPRTERFFREALMLPWHTEIVDAQVRFVCDRVRAFYAER